MSIGHKIIEEIIKQRMFTISHPDPDNAHVFVWSSGAAEQLEALVVNHYKPSSIKEGMASSRLVKTLARAGRDTFYGPHPETLLMGPEPWIERIVNKGPEAMFRLRNFGAVCFQHLCGFIEAKGTEAEKEAWRQKCKDFLARIYRDDVWYTARKALEIYLSR